MTSKKSVVKLTNILDGKYYMDTLHQTVTSSVPCTTQRCMGSLMSLQAHRPADNSRTIDELLVYAKDFIEQYYTSIKKKNSPAHQTRWQNILESVEESGTYELTTAELSFGCKLAWRNAARCIGRIQWSKLQVFDARHILTTRGMFEALCNHIKYATNKGNLRSAITIFHQRNEGQPDFRVWNSQLIHYAGYRTADQGIIGDPSSVVFTECIKMGWEPKYGRFDVLPLVVCASGSDPEWFDIPPELILEVKIKHPKYNWFADLGLKWYALPGVAGMLFDCGGLEFPACPFNGWYMETEIGTRDFCDGNRYNMLETIALKMGLDTSNTFSLWKDLALVECNVAVIHSYQSDGVTITDHHAASESFIQHMENEFKVRGGCPADWVWIVPPMSGSVMEVFHQEMLLYKLRPSYEYQTDPWMTHVWVNRARRKTFDRTKKKITFRDVARVVKFSTLLMMKAMSRRVKCVILFATETGKSERFARTLCEIFKFGFDAKVMCMTDYDLSLLEQESLLLIVTSTFGNGEPPENGVVFAKGLYDMKFPDSAHGDPDISLRRYSSYVRQSVYVIKEIKVNLTVSFRSSSLIAVKDPLENLSFSVFALGSKAYPHFAAFGHYVDSMLYELGAERIFPVGEGDELCGQEQSFRQWAERVFKAACETYCLVDDQLINEATDAIKSTDNSWTASKFRVTSMHNLNDPNVCAALSQLHSKKVVPCILSERTNLQAEDSHRQTILVRLNTQGANEAMFVPGDHVAIFPANPPDIVDRVLARLHNAPPPEEIIKTEVLHEVRTPLGKSRTWNTYEHMPVCSLRMALTYFIDVTTPPCQALLQLLATQASNDTDKASLKQLATSARDYEDWKYDFHPSFLEVLEQFPSIQVLPSLLLTQLPLLQQRYYSISSSPKMFPREIHATVAILKYRTQGGRGTLREGVCTSWLNQIPAGSEVPCFLRRAPNFHLPRDLSLPIIMVGPGTGIAPFRSFWQQRSVDKERVSGSSQDGQKRFGEMSMYFGCRTRLKDNIYGRELEEMKNAGVLSSYFVALSREPDIPKVYVQDLLLNNAQEVYESIVIRGGHFYLCGDVSMADDVTKTLERIIQTEAVMTAEAASKYVLEMIDSNRFHEDIFGVDVRRPADKPKRSVAMSNMAFEYLHSSTKLTSRNVSDTPMFTVSLHPD